MRYLPFLVASLVLLSSGAVNAQGADECANAQPIVLSAPGTVTVQIDNTTATTDPAIPAGGATCPGTALGTTESDVWFSWTAPSTGLLDLSTCVNAGLLDTDIILYDASAGCTGLIEIACNGDGVDATGAACVNFGSNLVGAGVFGGVTYFIRVGGWDAASVGTTDMDVTFSLGTIAPANLVCAYDIPTDTATLTWENLDQYDTLNYYLNGTLTGQFDGTAGAATDILTGFPPGLTTVCLEAEIGGVVSTQVCCTVFLPEPCPATVVDTMSPYETVAPLVGCVACQAGGLHADNSYLRSFDLVNGYGISDEITIECVTTSAESNPAAAIGTQPIRVRLIIDVNGGGPQNFSYLAGTNVGQTPDPGNTSMIMVYEEEFQVPQLNNIPAFNFILGTGVIDPDGLGASSNTLQCMTSYGPSAGLVIEIYSPDGQADGHSWFMNSGAATTQIGDSYIVANACGLTAPSPLSGIGFPDNRYIMDIGYSVAVAGSCGSAGGISNLQCAQNPGDTTWNLTWDDAGGAASWIVEIDGNVEATLPSTDLSFLTLAQPEYQDLDVLITSWTGAGGTGSLINSAGCTLQTAPANNWPAGASIASVGTFTQEIATPYTTTTGIPLDLAICDPGTGLTQINNDIFLRYTATVDGDLLVSTCGPNNTIVTGDTMLAVYTYDAALLDDPTLVVACSDDANVGANPTNNPACNILAAETIFSATSGQEYLIRLGTFNAAGVGTMEYTINDCVPATNITGTADCTNGDVTLNWTPNPNASSQEILRDGVSVATLGAGDTTYADLGVADGTYEYEVVTDCGSGPYSAALTVSVLTYAGQTDLIFAVEGLLSAGDVGLVDSGALLLSALTNAGRDAALVRTSWVDYPCVSDAGVQNVWALTGTVPADYRITAAEGDELALLGEAGKGVYFEGGDHFGFVHAASLFDARDGVDDTTYDTGDGDDTFTAMDGFDSGAGLDMSANQDVSYTQDQADNDWTDQLTVAGADAGVAAAGVIWASDDALVDATGNPLPQYNTGIASETTAGGNTVVQSWEIGGYGGDQSALSLAYAEFLSGGGGGGPVFKRGDTNQDGGFNIADEVFLLAALFSGGAPCDCADSCDQNDDGGVNIADAIYGLAALFSGGPAPSDPGPSVCGEDPTDDGLTCDSYNGC
ncbi:hypothetical protein CBD41_00880 [bacterium TMED181]|nr:hypothetical protein [Planctomycetota bacterium]OUW47486.1 MAG: hypothetical protein CBD41_00880 [bacterium TMED181]